MRDQQGRDIGTATKVRRMPKRHQTTQTQQEMQARCKQAEDDDVGRENDEEMFFQKRQCKQGNQQNTNQQTPDDTSRLDRTLRLSNLSVLARHFFTAKQTIRSDCQHDCHDDKHQHQSTLRQIRHTKDVQHGYQYSRDIGTGQ